MRFVPLIVFVEGSREVAYREWAESADYQEIAKDRMAGSTALVLLVKGIPVPA